MTDTRPEPSRPQPAATFVVYDRRTGAILHHHLVSAVPGAEIPEDDQLVRFILDHAVHATGRHANDVDCLKVPAGAIKPQTTIASTWQRLGCWKQRHRANRGR